MINTFYSTPLASIALQWFSEAKYMMGHPIAYTPGGLVLDVKTAESLPAHLIEKTTVIIEKKLPSFITTVRLENLQSIAALKEAGIKIIDLPQETIDDMKSRVLPIYEKMKGRIYPEELLLLIQKILKEHRAGVSPDSGPHVKESRHRSRE
jgi:TRAP-type C4-dicarboxylate transport system substrate-binding protein